MKYLDDWSSLWFLHKFEKRFSNLFNALLKSDLSVAHSSDQDRDRSEIFEDVWGTLWMAPIGDDH